MLNLKEICNSINGRTIAWNKFDDNYLKFLHTIDETILNGTIDGQESAIITLDFEDNNWVINNYFHTEYKDYDTLISLIKRYLIFNGFKEEDISLKKECSVFLYISL